MRLLKPVEVVVSTLFLVGSIVLFSESATAQCSLNTINADFEYPVITPSSAAEIEWRYVMVLDNGAFPQSQLGWQVVPVAGGANNHEIEFRVGGGPHNFPAAHSGNQYIELNADQESYIYQDFATVPGMVFTWSFWHCSRADAGMSQQTCELQAGPSTGTSFSSLYNATSPFNTWTHYTGTYTVPVGQTSTRFRFVSKYTDPARGNFLDDISFFGSVAAPTVTNPSPYCQNSPAASLTATGTNLLWYSSAVGGVGTTIPPTPDTSVPGSYDFWVSQTIGGCESTTRAKITVTVLPQPTATIAISAPSTVNIGDPAPVITYTGANGTKPYTFTYHINSGGNQTITTTVTSDIATITAPTTVGGTFTYELLSVKDNSSNMCSNTISNQSVTVTVLPTDPCIVNSINPDFEDAVLPLGATTGFVNQSAVTGWKTTASDGIMEFWKSGNESVPSFSGNQFIELNANMVSGVYQDFNTPEPAVFNFSFAHRGRLGTDVCGVFVGVPGGTMTQIATASDATTWGLHTGTYTIPAGQTSTRFEFRAISSAGGDPSIGNFLDAISFSSTIAPPIAPSATTYYCVGETPVAIPVVGSNLKWYASAIGGVGTSTQPSINTSVTGSNSLYVSQISAAGCESPRDTATITIIPLPSATITGTTTVCLGSASQNITFTGASGTSPYTFSYKINGGAIQTVTTTAGNSISISQPTTTAGTYQYDLLSASDASVKGCSSNVIGQNAIVTITSPTTPLFTSIGPLCQNSTPPALPSSSTNSINGTWSPATINTSSVGTTTYTFTPVAGQCATTATLAIEITGTTTPSFTATPAATLCQSSNAHYSITAGATTYNWSVPGVVGTDYQIVSGSLGTSSNDVTIKWLTSGPKLVTIDCGILGDCYYGSISNTTTITQTPSVNSVANITVCDGTIIPISTFSSTPAGATFSWTNSNTAVGLASNGSGSLPSFTATNSGTSPISATISVIADNGGCAGVATSFVITVNPIPTAPTLSVVNNCNNTSNLTASGYSGALLWSTSETAANIVVSTAGSYTATQTISGCVSPTATILAAPNSFPATPTAAITHQPNCTLPTGNVSITAPLGANMVYSNDGLNYQSSTSFSNLSPSTSYDFYAKNSLTGCVSPVPNSLTVAAMTPPPATPIVVSDSRCGAGIVNLSATGSDIVKWYADATLTTHITDGDNYSPSISNTTNYYVTTIENATGCESSATMVTGTVRTIPTAPTLSVVNNCNNTSNLTASGYSGALLWSTSETAPNIVVSTAGSYTATQTISGCVSPTATVLAAPNSFPATPTAAITHQPNCTLPTGTASITAPLGANMVYSNDGLNYQSSTSFSNLSPSTSYDLYAKNSLTGCVSQVPNSLNVAAMTPPPSTSVVVNDSRCGAGVVNLSATGSDIVKWYSDATLTTHITDGDSYSPSISNTTNYYVTTVENATGCESSPTMVTGTVRAIPIAPTLSVVNNCNNTSNLTASGYSGALLWSTSETAANIVVSTAGSYTATQTISGCVSPTATILAAPNSFPATPTAAITHQPNCTLPTGTVSITAPLGADMIYSNDGLNYQSSTSFNNLAPSTSYDFYAKNSLTGCVSPIPNSLTIAAMTPPPATPVVVNDSRCGAGVVNLSATGSDIVKWYADATLTTHITDGDSYSPSISNTTSYYVTTIENATGCESSPTMVTGTVRAIPIAPTLSVVNNCNNTSNLTASGYSGALLWSTSETAANIVVSTAGSYTATQTISGCVSPTATISAAPNSFPVTPTATITHQPNCSLPTGTVSITAPLGANMVYSSDGLNYQSSTTFSNLSPSTSYDFYAKNSLTGCVSQVPNSLTVAAMTPPPSTPVVVSDSRCGAGVVNLSATGSDIIKWYSDATLTTHITDGDNYSPSISNTTNYYVTTIENATGCESSPTMVTGTVRAIPTAPTVSSQISYCLNDASNPLNALGDNLLWYNSPNGTSSGTAITPSTNSVGIELFYVTQTVNNCESAYEMITVQTNDLPTVNIVLDSLFIYPKTTRKIEANAYGDMPLTYQWTPQLGLDNDTILTPSINSYTYPTLKLDYQLTVTSSFGCVNSDQLYVAVLPEITPPNVFSPNNDGINDAWHIENIDQYPEAHVSIFNRYGQFIYEKIGYDNDWDGTYNGSPLQIDTYFWIIKLQREGAIMKGTISIIR